MSLMSPAPMRTALQIPASTIFSPRELKHYRRWQRLYSDLTHTDQGFIPTAVEYDQFQRWLRRQDSGYFSDVLDDVVDRLETFGGGRTPTDDALPMAAMCRHMVHPAGRHYQHPRCPVCTIDIHISYMRVLQQALDSAGGRAPSCTLTASEHQENAYNAWLSGKVSTLLELSNLERLADEEAEWSRQHPEIRLDDVQTGEKALNLYWSEAMGVLPARPRTPRKKSVLFAQDTTFRPGRPSFYFWQKSPRYEPGRYTPSDHPAEDEDVVSEDSEDYSQATSHCSHGAKESGSMFADARSPSIVHTSEALEEDDGDSEWEDIEVDVEQQRDALEINKHKDGADIEEKTNFIVFAND